MLRPVVWQRTFDYYLLGELRTLYWWNTQDHSYILRMPSDSPPVCPSVRTVCPPVCLTVCSCSWNPTLLDGWTLTAIYTRAHTHTHTLPGFPWRQGGFTGKTGVTMSMVRVAVTTGKPSWLLPTRERRSVITAEFLPSFFMVWLVETSRVAWYSMKAMTAYFKGYELEPPWLSCQTGQEVTHPRLTNPARPWLDSCVAVLWCHCEPGTATGSWPWHTLLPVLSRQLMSWQYLLFFLFNILMSVVIQTLKLMFAAMLHFELAGDSKLLLSKCQHKITT